MSTLRTLRLRVSPILSQTRYRFNSTYEPPAAPKPNRHGGFYKNFGTPVLKNFLIAMITFQAIYWSWLKLEGMEKRKNGDEELKTLQGEVQRLTKDKSGA